MKRILYILAFIFFGLFGVVNDGWCTTYKLTQVTSVSAGNKYVFVHDGFALIGMIDGKKLQSTNSYNTTSLIGTESYVWVLETAIGGFYLKNASLNSNQYLNNTSGTNVSLDNKNSIWFFNFTNNVAWIQNSSNSDRFIGETTEYSHQYKAYATEHINTSTYPHDIFVYILEEEYTPPTPTTYDTITFRDIHNNKWTLKTNENNDTIFFHDTVPSEACRLNGWVFAGWSTDSLDETKIIKDSSYIIPTKNDTLYAFYKTKTNEAALYVIDTITYDKIGLGYHDAHYTDFNNVEFTSGSEYCGNIYRLPSSNDVNGKRYIQMRGSDNSGIVTTKSGGTLDSIWVIWNSATASGRTLNVYESNEAFELASELYNTSLHHKSIIYGTSNSTKLTGKKYIGIRSASNALYLDKICIRWSTNGLGYEYSTNPKCFETNISVAEWFEDKVEFDIGNYDSVHTYNGPMNSCDSIRIKITNDNDEECIRWFHVPVFAGANTIIDNLDCDIVILKDSTLTINSNISNNNVYVYPDGVLHIKENKTYTVNSLTLRRDNNDVPQFLYEGMLKVNDGMFFEMRTDAEDWRWLTLPDSIRIGEISDKPEVLLKYYDGNERAKNGRGGWKFLNKDSISGFGTIFGIDIDTDEKRIYKFRLDTNILSQEKLAHKHINVGKFNSDKPNDVGWNLVGNPFMTTYNVNPDFMDAIKFKTDSLVKEIINGLWTGGWITIEKDLRYIVVPSDKQEQHIIDAGGYEQICLQNGYKIKPFTSFFIQANDKGELVFYHGQRVVNAPSRISTANKNKETFLQICIGSIKTGCYISNKFNDSYEIGDDMESLYTTYQLINGYKLLYSAVNDSIIEHGIKFYTPIGNLHLDDKTNIEDFDEIYALYDGNWIDLLHGQTLDVSGEFILFAKRKNQETNPTDIDIIKDNNEVTKFMHNNNLYIKKNNHIFNILGGIIK